MQVFSTPVHTTLIIEDDQITTFLNTLLLDELNQPTEIVTACDGLEALEKLTTMLRLPDLILLDIKMSGMDGFDFLDKFEKIPGSEKTKVIILTSSVDYRDKIAASRHRIYSYLTKPLTSEAVKKILGELFLVH